MGKYYKTKGKGVIGKDHRTKTITRSKFERVKGLFPAFKSLMGKVVYYDAKNNMLYRTMFDGSNTEICVRSNLNKHNRGDVKFLQYYYGLDGNIPLNLHEASQLAKLQNSIDQYIATKTVDNSEEEFCKNGGGITMSEAHDMLVDTSGAIKSDGGKSDYYKIVLPQWLLDKQSERGFIMLEDLAEIMYGNDFNFTNVFKAQKRMFELKNGRGKEGNTFEYDATKVKYYVDKQVEVFGR